MHRSGDVKDAETLYRRILAAAPAQVDALHFLGILCHQTGRPDEAVALIRRAVALDPRHVSAFNNLGNVLHEQGRHEEAVEAYRAAVALKPDFADARSNLGVALRALGRLDEAEDAYREAIRQDPDHRESYDNLGRLLSSQGRAAEAIECHARAMELEPSNAESRRLLGLALAACGRIARAAEVFRVWLQEEPGNPLARHYLAACTGEDIPERASDPYVEKTFDGFADSFDEKLASLDYRAPALAGEAVARAIGEPRGDLAVLDAGCGTGLCGPMLRPYAARLTGVDLSGAMLAKAEARGGYDALEKAELTAYLLERPEAFDLAVCADTLCYFGALDAVSAGFAGALRPGGHLVFTVEKETGDAPFRLHPHGRYTHHPDHVRAALAAAGLDEPRIEEQVLRQEMGEPVAGLLVTARKR
jgi:predicted TPR repeat methyltransferase